MMSDLKQTALHALHMELGGKMVPFAGYDMPVQYPMGVLGEHLHTRAHAGLFDVGHMGQILLHPVEGMDALCLALEALVPVDVSGLAEGRQRYAIFTNDAGGISDDLMIAHRGDHLLLVVNAACKDADEAHLRSGLGDAAKITRVDDRGLLALQGPDAEAALAGLVPDVAPMRFMDVIAVDTDFGELWISRSGYSGEDGFEVSVPDAHVADFARALLACDGVDPVGLGARDSLRLEAGLCLYGSDLGTDTTPVEGNIAWAIQKARRSGGDRAGGFPGSDVILDQLDNGPQKLRVGLRPAGRAPMRAGTLIFANDTGGDAIGSVTSGAYGPSIEAPMSMGYIAIDHATSGTELWGEVRGKRQPVTVADMPFHPTTYKR